MHDVAIVGASLAGATCAIELVRLGHSVVLIDRAQFPRRKACGEGLFPPGVGVLRTLGLLDALLPQARALTSLRIQINGRTVEAPLSDLTLGIARETLDGALLRLAEKSGVDVRLGVQAVGLVEAVGRFNAVQTDQGALQASVIVAADGLRSRLRLVAGLEKPAKTRRFGVSAHYRLPGAASSSIRVFAGPGHEVYVTPIGERTQNVALLLAGRSRELSGDLCRRYDGFVRASSAVPPGAMLLDEPIVAGPFPAASTRVWRTNLVLAGDAAGFFDGISGEGMSLALISAQQCAQAVHAYLGDGLEKHFAAYDSRRRNLARNSTLLARLSLFLAAHPALGERVIGNLARRPATFAKLVAINQGAIGFDKLTLRDFLAFGLGV